ncbi:MAG: MFS transporter small subunit [Stellaceae bacterium]
MSNGLKLVLAWGLVGIPLACGVIETAINAAKLFQ